MSQTSSHTLESYRMSCFHQFFVFRVRPKLGVFSKLLKYSFICCFITHLFKRKPQQWSSYKVIEDILPLVLNSKWPLSDIWLLSYEQNNFGCFLKKLKFNFFSKSFCRKTSLHLTSDQPKLLYYPWLYLSSLSCLNEYLII